ncbi:MULTISPECIES: patatin-like phospholipase family protein [unclassified Lentilitoribacter]|jgi:NTE family protein|uniref:patatin-like phospholipase family protein n=1 Tax=unclassified Lentilitoribacter TaxID=2647570 RepID=UPI0013A6DAD8|nr:patatin-like phospholipase family protein [Lentilitoribacter sp. Alg239-R112]
MSDKTIAVAFGGGGARGFAHVHVIEVLDELGLTPVAISGTSVGAIMGSAMASGMSGQDIRSFIDDTLNDPKEIATRAWKARRPGWRAVFSEGVSLGQFNIERILSAFLPEQIPLSFDDLKIPTKLIATDYYGHHETIMDQGDLHSAIAASAAIPAVFKSVKRDGRFLIDGGIYNPLPFDHLEGVADVVIAIDVAGFPNGDDGKIPGTTDAAFGASQLMMQSIIDLRLQKSPPDIFLVPDIHDFRVLDFLRADEILASSVGIRDDLKRELERALS